LEIPEPMNKVNKKRNSLPHIEIAQNSAIMEEVASSARVKNSSRASALNQKEVNELDDQIERLSQAEIESSHKLSGS